MLVRFRKLGFATLLVVIAGLVACADSEVTRQEHKQKGAAFAAAGDHEKARVEFLNALRIESNDVDARQGAGEAFENLGSFSQALGHFAAAADLDALHLPSRVRMAKLLMMGGGGDQAAPFVEQALAIAPEDPDVRALHAGLLGMRGDLNEAERIAAEVVAEDPANQFAVPLYAARLVSRDQHAQAREMVEEAIARRPQDIGLRGVYAQVLFALGDEQGYLGELDTMMGLEPGDSGHVLNYATALGRAGESQAAIDVLRMRAFGEHSSESVRQAYLTYLANAESGSYVGQAQALIDTFPEDLDLQLSLAAFHRDREELVAARKIYASLMGVDSDRHRVLASVEAARLVAMDDPETARASVADILRENPANRSALLLASTLDQNAGDLESAISYLRIALRDDAENPALYQRLGQLYRENNQRLLSWQMYGEAVERARGNAQLLAEAADAALVVGDSDKAIELSRRAIDLAPASLEALQVAYRGYFAMGSMDQAFDVAQQITRAAPASGLGSLYQGLIDQARGRESQAEKHFAASLERQPGAIEPLSALLRMQLQRGDVKAARATLAKQKQSQPNNPLLAKYDGDIARSAGDSKGAQVIYEQALQRHPTVPALYLSLARLHQANGDHAKAITTLQTGVSQVQDRTLFEQLALTQQAAGSIDAAIESYRRGVRHFGQDQNLANNLAMVIAEYRPSEANLDEALRLVTDFEQQGNPAYLDTLGWVRVKRGEYDAAIRVLSKARDLVPDSGLVRFHLAKALIGRGSPDDAANELRAALDTGDSFSGHEEARQLLGRMTRS